MRRLLPFAILGRVPRRRGAARARGRHGSVAIRDSSFTPAASRCMPGESVTWTTEPGYRRSMHNVHFDGEPSPLGRPSTDLQRAAAVRRRRARTRYHCDVHPLTMTRHGLRQRDRHGADAVADGLAAGEPHRVADRATPTGAPLAARAGPAAAAASAGGRHRTAARFRCARAVCKRPCLPHAHLGASRAVRVRGTLQAAAAARAQRDAARAARDRHGAPAGEAARAGPLRADAARRRSEADRAASASAARLRGVAQQLWLLRHGEAVPHDSKPRRRARADRARRAPGRGCRRGARAARRGVRGHLHQPEGARAGHREARRRRRSTSSPRWRRSLVRRLRRRRRARAARPPRRRRARARGRPQPVVRPGRPRPHRRPRSTSRRARSRRSASRDVRAS